MHIGSDFQRGLFRGSDALAKRLAGMPLCFLRWSDGPEAEGFRQWLSLAPVAFCVLLSPDASHVCRDAMSSHRSAALG